MFYIKTVISWNFSFSVGEGTLILPKLFLTWVHFKDFLKSVMFSQVPPDTLQKISCVYELHWLFKEQIFSGFQAEMLLECTVLGHAVFVRKVIFQQVVLTGEVNPVGCLTELLHKKQLLRSTAQIPWNMSLVKLATLKTQKGKAGGEKEKDRKKKKSMGKVRKEKFLLRTGKLLVRKVITSWPRKTINLPILTPNTMVRAVLIVIRMTSK